MPLYEYQCEHCAHRCEQLRKFSDPPLTTCPECGGPVRKLPSAPAIQFKGTGWYITDYARKPAGDQATETSKEEAASDAKDSPNASSDSKTSDAKTSDTSASTSDSGTADAKPAAATRTQGS